MMEKPDKTKKRILIASIIGIVVLLMLWMMFRSAPVNVETAAAERGQMIVSVDGEGKTRIRDKVAVAAPVSGRMSRVQIREGDLVPKEYVITEIDPNPPTPRPPSETEDLINPHTYKVYAPITGRVLRILEKDARIISAGTILLEIGNPKTVEIVVDVLSTDAARIRAGSAVLIGNEAGGEPLRGRVRTVEPQAFTKVSALGVEEQRVNVVADFTTGSAYLGDNYRVDTRIIVWSGEEVLKIPSSALFRGSGDKWNVFVVEFGTARRREVAIGHQTSTETEILQGLNKDDIVVLHPPNQLTDGSSVSAR